MKSCALVVGAAGALLVGGSVFAETGAFWSISASTPGGTPSTWFIPSDALAEQGSYSLDLGAYGRVSLSTRHAVERGGSGDGCPEINLNFQVQSVAMVPTMFSITSALLAFPPTGNTFARLTGDLKVTDVDGSGSGTFTGGLSNGNGVGAFINGGSAGGTLISSAFASLVAPGEGMNTDSFDSGCVSLDGVMDMQLQWLFTISAGDSAGGSAKFLVCNDCGTVVPLPGAAGMGLAGFALVAARRRRA